MVREKRGPLLLHQLRRSRMDNQTENDRHRTSRNFLQNRIRYWNVPQHTLCISIDPDLNGYGGVMRNIFCRRALFFARQSLSACRKKRSLTVEALQRTKSTEPRMSVSGVLGLLPRAAMAG